MSFKSGTKRGEKNGLVEEEQFRPDRRGVPRHRGRELAVIQGADPSGEGVKRKGSG